MIRAYDEYGNIIDLAEWEKQIMAEAIDDCIEIVKFYRDSWDGIEWAIRDIEELKAGVTSGTDNK